MFAPRVCRATVLVLCLGLGAAAPGAADSSRLADALSDSLYPLTVATLGTMVIAGDQEMADTGRYGFDAVIATAAACEGLKRISSQPRPSNPYATDGFPSAHVATAFALARVISHQYPQAAPYLYAYAALNTWSRLEAKRHDWLQVSAGAALGTWLANESVHRDGGLLFGWIAPQRRLGSGGGHAAGGAVGVSITW